jgi:predicted amidohydrolase YtcJ
MAGYRMNRPPDMLRVRSAFREVAENRMVDVGDIAVVCDGDMLDRSELSAAQMHEVAYQHGRKDVSRRDLERMAVQATVEMGKLDAADYFGPPRA